MDDVALALLGVVACFFLPYPQATVHFNYLKTFFFFFCEMGSKRTTHLSVSNTYSVNMANIKRIIAR
jgi:hypothetical protein